MRSDGVFIGVQVGDEYVSDAALAAKLAEVCPVDIFAVDEDKLALVEHNLDECVLCRLCIDASPQGAVTIHKLYDDDATL